MATWPAPGDLFATLTESKGHVVADAAMGTQLFARGLISGDAPERSNLEQPETIREIHRGHVQAGAQVLLTNSFGANRFRLSLHDLGDRVRELNEAAARVTREAAEDGGRSGNGTVLVAGSMGPSGELLAPLGSMDTAACEAAFAEQAEGLARGGVDLLWIETMSDLAEAEAAVRGARAACDLPVAVMMSFDTAGRTMMGTTATETAERLGPLQLAAIGANCGNNIADTEAAAVAMRAALPDVPVIFKPNAGIPAWTGTTFRYDAGPETVAGTRPPGGAGRASASSVAAAAPRRSTSPRSQQCWRATHRCPRSTSLPATPPPAYETAGTKVPAGDAEPDPGAAPRPRHATADRRPGRASDRAFGRPAPEAGPIQCPRHARTARGGAHRAAPAALADPRRPVFIDGDGLQQPRFDERRPADHADGAGCQRLGSAMDHRRPHPDFRLPAAAARRAR